MPDPKGIAQRVIDESQPLILSNVQLDELIEKGTFIAL
jgi:hypothetical protein